MDSSVELMICTGICLKAGFTHEQKQALKKHEQSIVVEAIRSEERLLDETTIFLHQKFKNLSDEKKQMIARLHNTEKAFNQKKIMIVDDDIRNVYALSGILESKGATIIQAENGSQALQLLFEHPDTDLILMDIMMPIMNGYEAMIEIRKQERFENLAIIALTAKAMKEDKHKCIQAGANDYLPKPVEIEKLLSLIKVWIYQ